jgi:hypothetical protein
MSRISYLAMATACFFFGTSHGFPSARAMPVQQLTASGVVTVSSGCGLGVRRGPFDRCDPFYYAGYGSSYRNAYYIGPPDGALILRVIGTEFAGSRATERASNRVTCGLCMN